MATLDVRIAGPGFDTVRRLQPETPPLVIGRDSECTVCLPDPERNVSRRHLSVWNQDGVLHFHVLSVVNGVEMPFGEAPPGARGVLPAGQVLKLAVYSLTAEPAAMDAQEDPWSVFDHDNSGTSTTVPGTPPQAEADPFGEWGFESTFGGTTAGRALEADKLAVAGDLTPFFRGMGLDPASIGALSEGEMETIGRLARDAMLGLRAMHALAEHDKQELSSEDRTMMAAPQSNNPLQGSWPEEALMQYLFGGRAAGVGFMPPERAVRDAIGSLRLHEAATKAAIRALAEGLLREFEPDALKKRLLGSGARLFESARAWDAYTRYYEEQKHDLPAWVERMLGKYFTEAYVRESVRAKRGTRPGIHG
ncbi:type VI secretion system-associated FHA domain protein [Ramlibacter sp.]|uniref:type VI secretion system-associated FHA domain protein n=1 Tax=Ramlibacter sp. TaxID=1917967 RepID=UPI0017EC443B|nr:type VI secretion system-associated FHA domain protein [Ramlibacter sp.]MBA2672612.1 FHA domain-containing protein [Ramlibacter sp.]